MKERDLIVIGGGVAGLTASIFAARLGLDTLLLERLMPGGQVINAETVEDFPGFQMEFLERPPERWNCDGIVWNFFFARESRISQPVSDPCPHVLQMCSEWWG